jgi:hypothetical protein
MRRRDDNPDDREPIDYEREWPDDYDYEEWERDREPEEEDCGQEYDEGYDEDDLDDLEDFDSPSSAPPGNEAKEGKSFAALKREHYAEKARSQEEKFRRTKLYWDAVKAAGYWRMADQPANALAITEGLAGKVAPIYPRLKSAVLTARGAAFRDLGHLDEAESHGLGAVAANDEDYHPCMLLGAVYYQKGNAERGANFFARAVDLGAKPEGVEWRIKDAVRRAGKEVQRDMARHLLKEDPERYGWAKQYLKGTPG